MAWLSAPKMRSAFLWLVSTFPPETGAGKVGFSTVPSGTLTCRNLKVPPFTGTSAPITVRNT